MDARPARLIREVAPDEVEEELVNEARAFTWTLGVEVALVTLTTGGRVFVSGGRDGITFGVVGESDGSSVLVVDRPGDSLMVLKVDWHTHPIATGPSDGDREALRILGQASSRVFEIGGERHGTSFGPDREKPAGH